MPAETPLDIKRKIRSVQSTQQITRAMNMVAAARLRRAESNMRSSRPYSRIINEFLMQVLPSLSGDESPLLVEREAKSAGIIVITSDKGLCGAFNTNIFRQTEQLVRERPRLDYHLYCLGKKAVTYFTRRKMDIRSEYTDLFRASSLPMASSIVDEAVVSYIEGEIDELHLIYSHFENVAVHPVLVRKLLPVNLDEIIERIPDADKGSREEQLFDFEPDMKYLCGILLGKYLSHELYHAMLESFASELGARMTAMESATDNAQEMLDDLTLKYNNVRQSAITTEIVEIASTAEAMK